MVGLTRQTAEFIASLQPGAIPVSCIEAARMGITDCVAVMIAGASEDAPRLVAAMVPASITNEGAPEIPSERNLSAPDAALVNGVAAHVLDYDDVALDGHTSVVLTPALLAEGWTLGSRGSELLAAYVAGYEVWALLQDLEPGHLHERGFHPTAVYGSLATAAACAYLNHLDADRTAHAIGIAASLASGLVANFGTMTKSLHAGRTAQAGVLAARLAKAGFTAAPDVLEHATGFMRAHSPSGEPDLDERDHALGRNWRLPERGVNVKRYPLCYSTHRSIDAMLGLVDDHDLAPDDVREIRVHTGRTQMLMLRNRAPKTGLEAKFSMEFAMASALVARNVGLFELSDAFVRRPEVAAAMSKVRCTTTDETMDGLPFAPSDIVSVVLASGETLEHPPVTHARGSWQKPLGEEELRAKFMDCAARRLETDQASALFERLWALDRADDLRDLPLAARPH
jgi:2-methylcitrate dehydratase PrpD